MIKLLYKRGIINKVFIVILVFLLVIATSYLFWQPASEKINRSFAGKELFKENLLLNHVYRIFDLGVVDLNLDRNLDIFTSNHNHGQFLLIGDGQGNFSKNVTADRGLDQDREFPGLEYAGNEPTTKQPGLYIYWKERNLIIKNHQNNYSIQGTIRLFAPVNVKQKKNFQVEVNKKTIETGAEASTINFTSQSETGVFDFRPKNVSLPISFQLHQQIPLENIYIGNLKIHPQSHQFTFYLRDRHGMAWTDYNNSGSADVFIVRGGLKGRMDKIPHTFNDELLIDQKNNVYQDQIANSGLVKRGCPALQTAWVDIDNDGLLDIYTVCYRSEKGVKGYPNQLYHHQSNNQFVDLANESNLAIPEMGTFTWFDLDRDGDQDLFWVDKTAFWFYQNNAGKFEPIKLANNPGNVAEKFEQSNQLTIADYDADGDLDIFTVSPKGNALLVNDKGKYQLLETDKIGLPSQGLTANWIDYDNDGLSDLHLIPGGLYRQKPNHQFEATGMLAIKSPNLLEARATWFDADNNGTRDLLLATRYTDSLSTRIYQRFNRQAIQTSLWQVKLYPNFNTNNHWLEINLAGKSENPQAIGSLVELTTDNGTQTQVIGQAEGSHFSQGHYRLYFGLGQQQTIRSLKIYWADGYVRELNNLASNQLLTISRERG